LLAGISLEYLAQVHISRSSGQGQGHGSKKHVCISHLQVVCYQLKGNINS